MNCEVCGKPLTGTIDIAAQAHIDRTICNTELKRQLAEAKIDISVTHDQYIEQLAEKDKEIAEQEEQVTDLLNTIGYLEMGINQWKNDCEKKDKRIAELESWLKPFHGEQEDVKGFNYEDKK